MRKSSRNWTLNGHSKTQNVKLNKIKTTYQNNHYFTKNFNAAKIQKPEKHWNVWYNCSAQIWKNSKKKTTERMNRLHIYCQFILSVCYNYLNRNYLSIYLSIYLVFIHPPVLVSIYLSIYLSIQFLVCICLFVYISDLVSIYLYIYISSGKLH